MQIIAKFFKQTSNIKIFRKSFGHFGVLGGIGSAYHRRRYQRILQVSKKKKSKGWYAKTLVPGAPKMR